MRQTPSRTCCSCRWGQRQLRSCWARRCRRKERTWRRRGGESTTIREEGQSNLGGGEVVLHPGGHPHPPHQLLHAAAHLEGQVKLGVKIKDLPLYRDVALLHGDDDALRVDEEGGAEGDVFLRLGQEHLQNLGRRTIKPCRRHTFWPPRQLGRRRASHSVGPVLPLTWQTR